MSGSYNLETDPMAADNNNFTKMTRQAVIIGISGTLTARPGVHDPVEVVFSLESLLIPETTS